MSSTTTSHPSDNISYILHRTPWRPNIAVSANRSEILLQDGRKLLDAVGGAAVTAVGMGHPKVIKAVQDQVQKVACTTFRLSPE
jgi:4-aminobutyrate aminotransferase-like enzyme